MWTKNAACRISKQRMSQPSVIAANLMVSPEGTRDGNKECLQSSSHQTAATPSSAAWRNSGWENTGYWPQIAEVYVHQRNDFSELRLLHLPTHKKALNSLTWDIWFSLINNNLLTFQLPALCCKNSYISWLPPCLLRTVFSTLSKMLSPGLKS